MTTIENVETLLSGKALLEASSALPTATFQDGIAYIPILANASVVYEDQDGNTFGVALPMMSFDKLGFTFTRALIRAFSEDMSNAGALSDKQKTTMREAGKNIAAEVLAKRRRIEQNYLNGEFDVRGVGEARMTPLERETRDVTNKLMKAWEKKQQDKKGGKYKLPVGEFLEAFRAKFYAKYQAEIDAQVKVNLEALESHAFDEDADDELSALADEGLEAAKTAKAEAEAKEKAEAQAAKEAAEAAESGEEAPPAEAQAEGTETGTDITVPVPEAPVKGGKKKDRKAAA